MQITKSGTLIVLGAFLKYTFHLYFGCIFTHFITIASSYKIVSPLLIPDTLLLQSIYSKSLPSSVSDHAESIFINIPPLFPLYPIIINNFIS